jgi:hypothetical protein
MQGGTADKPSVMKSATPNSTGTTTKPDEDWDKVRSDLRKQLLPQMSNRLIASYIWNFLSEHGRKIGSREKFAYELGEYLSGKAMLLPRRNLRLQRLIENRPRELSALVWNSFWVDDVGLGKYSSELQRPKRRRAKICSAAERKQSVKRSKRQHEIGRGFARLRPGLIETDFSDSTPDSSGQSRDSSLAGKPLINILFGNNILPLNVTPGGPCLDDVFGGDEVEMTHGYNSLENLFGRSRKLLPQGLPRRRLGLKFFYSYIAVLKCIDALLNQKQGRKPWLADPQLRRTVLETLLSRAREKATPEVLAAFQRLLHKHLGKFGKIPASKGSHPS